MVKIGRIRKDGYNVIMLREQSNSILASYQITKQNGKKEHWGRQTKTIAIAQDQEKIGHKVAKDRR